MYEFIDRKIYITSPKRFDWLFKKSDSGVKKLIDKACEFVLQDSLLSENVQQFKERLSDPS